MNLFEYSLTLNGFPIRKAKAALKDIKAIPKEHFQEYVDKKRWEIVNYHKKHNPFYKELIGTSTINDWADIPILTKRDLQRPIEERLSDAFSKKSVYINKTSGSSGHPFVFAKDKFAHALTWAEYMDRFGWHGLDFDKDLQARFYGIPMEPTGYWKERLKDYLSSRYRFPIFDLSDQKLAGFLKIFRVKPFTFINGYTSSIVAFARYVASKDLVLKKVCPTLRCCVVTSEMLFEDDRMLMEKTFGVPVINEYGACELDLIAFENTQGEFVVNSETLFVEIVSKEGLPVPYGSPGRIVITALYNKAHPMIRYDVGDTGILDPSSTPMTPVLNKLIGRTNDFALLSNGKKVPGLTFYYVTKSVITDRGEVREFVVEQTAPSAFTIRYVADHDLNDDVTSAILNALERYVNGNLDLTLIRESVLKRTARGKLMQFTRSF